MAKRFPKTYRYTVNHPDGRSETVRVHVAWSGFEVAAKWQHSLVFFHIPNGHSVSAKSITGYGYHPIYGPALVLVTHDDMYEIPQINVASENGAYRAYRESAASPAAA